MNCELIAHSLEAYVDRELDVEQAAAVRAHLNECTACRRHHAEFEALGRLVRGLPYEAAPDHLRSRIAAVGARRRSFARALPLAAAALLVLSAGAGIGLMGDRSLPPLEETSIAVVDGHVRSLMADHLFDVESTDQHTVKPWFLGRLDFSPPVIDLADIGYPLVGGRLDYLDGRAVAALVYRRRQHTINVFVAPGRGKGVPRTEERAVRGFYVVSWSNGGMDFWAVSDLNEAELRAFASALDAP